MPDQATGASHRLFSGQRALAADAELTICLLCPRGGTGRAERLPEGGQFCGVPGPPGAMGEGLTVISLQTFGTNA